MSALALLMIIGAAGLGLSATLGAVGDIDANRLGTVVAIAASIALAAAGIVAVFGRPLVWQPFSWFPFGRGGVQVDSLAGFFLILTGLVSASLFTTARTQAPRAARGPASAARALRRRRCRGRQRVRVPDRL